MGPSAFRQAIGGLGFHHHSGPNADGYELWVVSSRVHSGQMQLVTIPDIDKMSDALRRFWFERLRERLNAGWW